MILNTLLALMLSLVLIVLNTTISKKMEMEREKPSPFECGFDPKSPARLPFSLRFYLVAVVFLIFDVEITLIMPLPMIFNLTNMTPLLILTLFFMLILLAGLYHEWSKGALDWDN